MNPAVACFGCITVCGGRDFVARRLVFMPPKPAGYVFQNGEVMIRGQSNELVRVADVLRILGCTSVDITFYRVQIGRRLSAYERFQSGLGSTSSVACMYFQAAGNTEKWTILFSHANATDLGYHFGTLLYLMKKIPNVNILSYDYPGYGLSDGSPNERNTYVAVQSIYDFAVETLYIPPNRIILYGQSLGSGPSLHIAGTQSLYRPVSGLILHSPIASCLRFVGSYRSKTPWFDMYKNDEKCAKVCCPVLVMHGTEDVDVPISHSLLLLKNLVYPSLNGRGRDRGFHSHSYSAGGGDGAHTGGVSVSSTGSFSPVNGQGASSDRQGQIDRQDGTTLGNGSPGLFSLADRLSIGRATGRPQSAPAAAVDSASPDGRTSTGQREGRPSRGGRVDAGLLRGRHHHGFGNFPVVPQTESEYSPEMALAVQGGSGEPPPVWVWWAFGAGHNDIDRKCRDDYIGNLVSFIDTIRTDAMAVNSDALPSSTSGAPPF